MIIFDNFDKITLSQLFLLDQMNFTFSMYLHHRKVLIESLWFVFEAETKDNPLMEIAFLNR